MSSPHNRYEPPTADVGPGDGTSLVGRVGVFILKSVAFSMIFWFVWTFVMRPLSAAVTSSGVAGQSQSQDTQQDALMKKYWDQAKAADDLQARAVRQTEESDRLLVKQAELQKRFEAVIEGWERQLATKR